MSTTLVIGKNFEATKVEVIAAMLYPLDERLRNAYSIRNKWTHRIGRDASATATVAEIQALLDLPSRRELQIEAAKGVRTGTVAGDLLALIYEQWRLGAPEPSLRGALLRYRQWSIGKRYGDGDALMYSDAQLRRYFQAAKPAAHLWAGYRLLKNIKDDGASYRTAFEPQGLPLLMGVSRAVQDFAATFVPKRTDPAKPVVSGEEMHRLPDHIDPIRLEFGPL